MALGKPTNSSSSCKLSSCSASNVVDGHLNSTFESDPNDITPWLAIDLTTPSLISQVVLYIPGNYSHYLYNTQVRISNTSIASTNNDTDGISGSMLLFDLGENVLYSIEVINLTLKSPTVAQWVTLQNFRRSEESGTSKSPI